MTEGLSKYRNDSTPAPDQSGREAGLRLGRRPLGFAEKREVIASAPAKYELGETGKSAMRGPQAARREGTASADQQEHVRDDPVSRVPWPEGMQGPEKFEKISYEDALKCTNEISKMRPLIKQGYKSEDFARLDIVNGKQWENGQQRVCDLYYGSDPIILYEEGDTFVIDRGRHRVYAAKVAGVATIPAKVREMKRNQ